MFYGILAKYTGYNYAKELKEDAKPYHAKFFFILNIHKPNLSKEVDKLI